jgi:hypothetical protein
VVIPQIKRFECLQYDPIELWVPLDAMNVTYQLTVFIGQKDSQASDMFYINVSVGVSGFIQGKYLILEKYDWELVVDYITENIRLCSDNDWASVAKKICKFMDWEFDNYQVRV